MRRPFGTWLAALAATAWTARARALDKTDCANAYVAAQTHRGAHELLAARADLRACARSECDGALHGQIVRDCIEWLAEVQESIPSIVLATKNEPGQPVASDVVVFIDGGAQPNRVDGLGIELDPGPHTFAFTAGSFRTQRSFIVLEGVKNQLVEQEVPVDGTQATTSSPFSARPSEASTAHRPFVSARTLVPLAIGAVGLGVGAAFGLVAVSDKAKLDRNCPNGACSPPVQQSDIDALHTTSWISNVAFGIGGLGVLAGIALWAVERPASSSPTTSSQKGTSATYDLRFAFGLSSFTATGRFP
jgi:hypothetical protein